jgi:hypothetical protein
MRLWSGTIRRSATCQGSAGRGDITGQMMPPRSGTPRKAVAPALPARRYARLSTCSNLLKPARTGCGARADIGTR